MQPDQLEQLQQIEQQAVSLLPSFQEILNNFVSYLPRLVGASLVIFIGFKLQPLLTLRIKHFFDTHDYDESLERFLQSLFGITYKILIILIAISIAGIETASIVAALGAAGFAVGLALQGSMSNFASGILILTLKPIQVGEFVKIDGELGTVKSIDIFNTTLTSPDNKTVIIPNSQVTNDLLINYSRESIRRIEYEIGVGYDADIKKVKKIIETTVRKNTELIIENEDKSITVGVNELGDSAIIFSVWYWCESPNYLEAKFRVLESIKEALDKEKVDIPYPTVTLANYKK